MRLSNWRRGVFLSARARAGISAAFCVHDLRHTAASLMVQAGYPPKIRLDEPEDDPGENGPGL